MRSVIARRSFCRCSMAMLQRRKEAKEEYMPLIVVSSECAVRCAAPKDAAARLRTWRPTTTSCHAMRATRRDRHQMRKRRADERAQRQAFRSACAAFHPSPQRSEAGDALPTHSA